jgi:hypothetical protein
MGQGEEGDQHRLGGAAGDAGGIGGDRGEESEDRREKRKTMHDAGYMMQAANEIPNS